MKRKKIIAVVLFIVIMAVSTCSLAYYNQGARWITKSNVQVENSSYKNSNIGHSTGYNKNTTSSVQNNSARTNIRGGLRDVIKKIFDFFFGGNRKTQNLTAEILTANNVKFEDKTFTYDGETHSIEVENLPYWATVTYENNELTDAGETTVKAIITPKKDSNYTGEVTLTAKITVEKKILEEQDLLDLNVKFEDKTFTYDGYPHDLKAENLPDWVMVRYVNNAKVNPQTAVVTAVITAKEDSNYEGTVKLKATLTIVDAYPLRITLNGEDTLTLEAGSEYTEEGATVTNNNVEIKSNLGPIAIRYYKDPTDTSKQEVLKSVDTKRVGVYKLIYIYKDSEKNQAVDSTDETKDFVMRTLIIQDTTAPEMTLNGEATITLKAGSEYIEEGVTITDNLDETRTNVGPMAIRYYADPSNTSKQDVLKSVDTKCVGVYKLIYLCKDSAKNEGVDANDHSKNFVMRTLIIEE